MALEKKHRVLLEVVLWVVSLGLLAASIQQVHMPGRNILIGYGLYLVYWVMQLRFRLGLTLPFAAIVAWMIAATLQWNKFQAIQSFYLEDYYLAMSMVANALIGVVMYFENKNRW
jgi:hypothetical protein